MAVLRTPEELTEKLKVGRLGFHQGKGRWQVYTREDGKLVTYYVDRDLEPLVEKLAAEKGEELRKPLRGPSISKSQATRLAFIAFSVENVLTGEIPYPKLCARARLRAAAGSSTGF